jgi:hypothetical protein
MEAAALAVATGQVLIFERGLRLVRASSLSQTLYFRPTKSAIGDDDDGNNLMLEARQCKQAQNRTR